MPPNLKPRKGNTHMGTNTPNTNRTDEITADQKLIDGLNKHATSIPGIVIAGASATTKDIVVTLQSRVDSARTVQSSRASWLAAVQTDRALRDKTKTYVSGLRQALLVAFAGQIDVLADFGLTPRKPRVVTPEEKVATAAKARATRVARHTMGKKQKAAIKGTVAPTEPAPAPAPSPPVASPPATPAPTPVMPAPAPGVTTPAPVLPVTAPAPVPPASPPASPVTTAPTPAPEPVPPVTAPAPVTPTSPPVPPVPPVTTAPTAPPVTPTTPSTPGH
jgi:hypothetical protein